jgi:magnesium-protoporphyrin IX monomethyl ester (oxidative) cyclase
MEKDATLEQIRNAFHLTKQAGVQAFAYMMIGIPTETYEEIQETIRFAISLDADYAQFSICTPYPKTELTQRMLRDAIIKYDYWQQFAQNPTEGFEVRFWNPTFSEEQLRALQAEAHARFYGRPSYILKKLMEVRSWNEFHAKLRIGGRLLLKLRKTAGVPAEQYIQSGG